MQISNHSTRVNSQNQKSPSFGHTNWNIQEVERIGGAALKDVFCSAESGFQKASDGFKVRAVPLTKAERIEEPYAVLKLLTITDDKVTHPLTGKLGIPGGSTGFIRDYKAAAKNEKPASYLEKVRIGSCLTGNDIVFAITTACEEAKKNLDARLESFKFLGARITGKNS